MYSRLSAVRLLIRIDSIHATGGLCASLYSECEVNWKPVGTVMSRYLNRWVESQPFLLSGGFIWQRFVAERSDQG
jgi:hypothetical protein